MTEAKPQHPARATYDSNTLASQDRFLHHYSVLGNIVAACDASGVGYQTTLDWRHDDIQGFLDRFGVAKECFADYVESVALKRVLNPEGNRGSDTLVMFMLNGLRPEKYKPELRQAGNTNTPAITQIIIHMPANNTETKTADETVVAGLFDGLGRTCEEPLIIDAVAKLVPEEDDGN